MNLYQKSSNAKSLNAKSPSSNAKTYKSSTKSSNSKCPIGNVRQFETFERSPISTKKLGLVGFDFFKLGPFHSDGFLLTLHRLNKVV